MLLVLHDSSKDSVYLSLIKAQSVRQCDLRFKPDFGLAVRVGYVYMRPLLFPRKEKISERSVSEDGG